jgi:hypothetical protein
VTCSSGSRNEPPQPHQSRKRSRIHYVEPTTSPLGIKKRDLMKYLAVILAIALGVAAIVYGEADDSPGAQLLGVLLVVGAVVLGVRMVRRRR